MSIKKKLIALIVVTTILRCIAAATIGLGNDEVYYLSYAQHLQWNYFDHPPMVALLIRLTSFNLYFQNEFFVRLGPVILSALNTLLIYDLVKKLRNEQAGFIAAILFSASFYSSVIAGVFILPDSPQLVYWIISIALLVDIISGKLSTQQINYKLLLFGIVAGLCIMSKVHGIFLWLGFGLYIVIYQRKLLGNVYLYLGALLTAIIISPILIWNIQNDFITYTYHGSRVAINSGIQIDSFIREFAGGILYNNPFNYFLIVIALTGVFKNRLIIEVAQKRLLIFLSLPLIILLLGLSLFRDTLPHWSGPGYISLIILAACYIDSRAQSVNNAGIRLRRIAFSALLFLYVMVIVGIVMINFMPGTIGNKDPKALGDGDFTLELYGWPGVKTEFKKIHDADKKDGVTKTDFIISNKWFPAAHIDNYIAQPLHLNFIAIGGLNDIHTYAWLNEYRKKIQKGDDAYFITFSNDFCDPVQKYHDLFESIDQRDTIQQQRGGKPVRNVFIYLMKNYKGK